MPSHFPLFDSEMPHRHAAGVERKAGSCSSQDSGMLPLFDTLRIWRCLPVIFNNCECVHPPCFYTQSNGSEKTAYSCVCCLAGQKHQVDSSVDGGTVDCFMHAAASPECQQTHLPLSQFSSALM